MLKRKKKNEIVTKQEPQKMIVPFTIDQDINTIENIYSIRSNYMEMEDDFFKNGYLTPYLIVMSGGLRNTAQLAYDKYMKLRNVETDEICAEQVQLVNDGKQYWYNLYSNMIATAGYSFKTIFGQHFKSLSANLLQSIAAIVMRRFSLSESEIQRNGRFDITKPGASLSNQILELFDLSIDMRNIFNYTFHLLGENQYKQMELNEISKISVIIKRFISPHIDAFIISAVHVAASVIFDYLYSIALDYTVKSIKTNKNIAEYMLDCNDDIVPALGKFKVDLNEVIWDLLDIFVFSYIGTQLPEI